VVILHNASKSSGLRNYTRFITNTNTNTFSDADLDASLNMYYHLFVGEILAAQDDWDFQGDYATTDLVANQQEYVLPSDILKIKDIEVTYDGTNWYKVSKLDHSEIGTATDATSNLQNFTTDKPNGDLMDNSIFLYPVPSTNVSGGLKIWFAKEVTELSAATDEPVFAEAYQKGLCYGAAKDYFEKYLEIEGNVGKRDRMENNTQDIVNRMKEFYNTKDQDRDYIVGTYDAGFESEYGY